MSLFKKVKNKENCFLALDIGTEFVKAVIFKINQTHTEENQSGKEAVIVGFGRQRQMPLNMEAGSVANIEGVALTCQQALNQAMAMARLKPQEVVVGVAGELVRGFTASYLYQRTYPEQPIDSAEIKNIIQKIQWQALQRVRAQLAEETSHSEIEIKLINALVSDIQIDGHRVSNPLGFQGKEVLISIFNVYAPLVHLSALEGIVQRLGLSLGAIISTPYALTRSSVFDSVNGAIFIDVGGGTTDIALVNREGLEGIKSMALAGRSFTKHLAGIFSLSLFQAEQLKIKYSQQQISQRVKQQINKIFKKDFQIWLNGLELVLDEFCSPDSSIPRVRTGKKCPFPSLILLCGGGSLLPEIRQLFKREMVQRNWLKKFPFNQLPQVRFIQFSHLNNIVDQIGFLGGPADITPMALAGLSVDSLSREGLISSTLRRIVRIMP